MTEYAIVTTIQTGTLRVEHGQVIGAQVAAAIENWDAIRALNAQGIGLDPPLSAVTYRGQRKVIVHDDPEENVLDQEFKVFD